MGVYYCPERESTGPLPNNGCPIVERLYCRNVFIEPLPGNGHMRHNIMYVEPRKRHLKIQRIQVRRAWRPCSGSSSAYPSTMTCVIENISHTTPKCAGAPSRILPTIAHKLNVSRHMLIWIFFLFWYVKFVSKICPHTGSCILCNKPLIM
jgi:hypothetical protein